MEFSGSLRDALRGSEALDYVTESKLRAARVRALEAARTPRRGWRLSAALASALFAITAITSAWLLRSAPGADDAGLAQAEAVDVLTDDLDPEFYQDLDLYRWLSQSAADTSVDRSPQFERHRQDHGWL